MTDALAPPEATQTPLRDDILWGAQAIADELGRDVRAVYFLCQRGLLDVSKVGDVWTTTRTRLRAQFNGTWQPSKTTAESATPARKPRHVKAREGPKARSRRRSSQASATT